MIISQRKKRTQLVLPSRIDRSDLEQTMMGAKKLADQIAAGTAKVDGNVGILE